MTREQLIEAIEEYEIPMTRVDREDGAIELQLGNDKALSIIMYAKSDMYMTIQSNLGSYVLSVNILYDHLELRTILEDSGFVVNDNSGCDDASVAVLW